MSVRLIDVETGKKYYHPPIVLWDSEKGIQSKTITFCKDCKYWTECSFLVPPTNFCGRLMKEYHQISEGVEFEMNADDFCSRGVRKDG